MANMVSNHLEIMKFTENGSTTLTSDFESRWKPPFYFYIELSKMLGVNSQINAKYEEESWITWSITVIDWSVISENQETRVR